MVRRQTILLCLAVCIAASTAQAQQETYPMQGCGNRTAGACRPDECQCEEWWVDFYTRAGKVWGADSAKTLAALPRKIEKSQKFDESYARFFNTTVESDPYNHSRPGTPICKVKCQYEPSAQTQRRHRDRRERDRIEQEADGLGDAGVRHPVLREKVRSDE